VRACISVCVHGVRVWWHALIGLGRASCQMDCVFALPWALTWCDQKLTD
jgi:hypothetical protein